MPIADVNGIQLYYELGGPDGAPALVFSNSIGTDAGIWDAQWAAFTPRFRCLRYDTRGHGRSQVVDAPITIDDLATDLAALMQAVGIAKAHIVGLSLGGMTAQALASSRPELVDRLVLCATAAEMPPPSMWRERAETVRNRGMQAISDGIIGRWFTPARQGSPDALRIKGMVEAINPIGYARCCEVIGAMDLRPQLSRITAPTLAVAGEADPAATPAMMEALRAGIVGAELVVIPDAAHLVSVERPEELTAVIARFLLLDRTDCRTPCPTPSPAAFEAGLANRRAVLGSEHVERSLAKAGEFAAPWQDFITRYAWGEIWGDDDLPWKTRSLITLAITLALGREEEFKLHLRPALKNGVTPAELRAFLKQAAIYAGVPAANAAFRWSRDALGTDLP